MTAYLNVVFVVVDRDEQQQSVLFAFARTDTPAARDGQRVIKDVLIAGCPYRNHGKLDVAALLQGGQDFFHALVGRGINDTRVINDVSKRIRRRQRRVRLLSAGASGHDEQTSQQRQAQKCTPK